MASRTTDTFFSPGFYRCPSLRSSGLVSTGKIFQQFGDTATATGAEATSGPTGVGKLWVFLCLRCAPGLVLSGTRYPPVDQRALGSVLFWINAGGLASPISHFSVPSLHPFWYSSFFISLTGAFLDPKSPDVCYG